MENKNKIIKYFDGIWTGIFTVLVGMGITWKHLWGHKVTMQYPDKYDPLKTGFIPEFARNRLFVDMDLCIGCGICQKDCPVNCIDIETIKASKDDADAVFPSGKRMSLWVSKFDIDFAKCMCCNLCTENCPEDCIYMTREFEFSDYDRTNLIYHFSKMTNEQIVEKQRIADEEKAKKAAAPKPAPAAAQKPDNPKTE